MGDSEECTHEFGENIEEIDKRLVLSSKFSQPNWMGKNQGLQLHLHENWDQGSLLITGSENKAAKDFSELE